MIGRDRLVAKARVVIGGEAQWKVNIDEAGHWLELVVNCLLTALVGDYLPEPPITSSSRSRVP